MAKGFPSLKWVRQFWLLLGISVVVAIAMAACNPQQLHTKEAQGSQIIASTLGDPATFNYAFNNEFPNIFIFTHSALVDEDGITGDVIPDLAESWKISEDKKQIVFTLREGLKWSDGHPLTAEDVVFTFNDIYLNEAIQTDVRDGLRIGESRALPKVRKLDDRHVEFTTPEPFSPFLRQLEAYILPAHILRETVHTLDSKGKPKFYSTWGTDTDPKKIVVSGPYTIESYTTSQRIIYRRNPYYWRKGADGKSQPYIERIIWLLVGSTDTQLLKFRSGEMDMLGLSPKEFSLLKQEEKRGDFTIYQGGPRSGNNYLSFNLNKATSAEGKPLVDPIKSRWFNNKAFRQAVAYAINRPKMLNNVFRGIGTLQNSPVSVQTPYYLPPEKGLKVYDYNPAKAKELLISAGFKYNPQGKLLDAEGNLVRFGLMTNAENKQRIEMAAQIKDDLDAIGMQVDFQPISFTTLGEKLANTRDWDCYLLGFTGGFDPYAGSNKWTSKGGSHYFNQGPQPGQQPIKGWVTSDWEKEIDRLFIAVSREFDLEKQKDLYGKYQQIVQEELPEIFLVVPEALSAIRNRVENVKYSGLDSRGSLWNLYELAVKD